MTKPHQKTMQTIPFKIASHDPETRSFMFVASDGSIDRQGDVVDQTTWDFDNYNKNPVVLWAHDYDSFPIARTLSIGVNDDGQMIFQPSFATAAQNPDAETAYQLILGGFLNACSVGFIPDDVVPAKDGSSYMLKGCELLEISIVSVPANANAIRLAADSGVISIKEKEMLIGQYTKALEALTDETNTSNKPPMKKVEKAGAKHSAATMEALQKAMDHCSNAVGVIKTLMSDGNDNDPEAEGGRGEGNSEGKTLDPKSPTNKDIKDEDPKGDANSEEEGASQEDEDPEMTEEEQKHYEATFEAELAKLTTGKVE